MTAALEDMDGEGLEADYCVACGHMCPEDDSGWACWGCGLPVCESCVMVDDEGVATCGPGCIRGAP